MDECLFPAKQILIINSNAFFNNSASEMKKVYEFLEIEPHIKEDYFPKNSGKYPSLSTSLRNELRDFYQPYNQKLEDLLNREFNWD